MITYTKRTKRYRNLHPHLKSLDAMVGMQTLKCAIVAQLQFLMANGGKLDDHFLNTSISGPPGCGKTSVAQILFNIWNSVNSGKSDREFHILHRSDFVGSYMGHTANKTLKMLRKHSGHVIFLDEAYTLVTGDKDEYGKEALDQLNAFMSEEKSNTIVIIAGYENELEEHFFSCNEGLRRRFGWFFKVSDYTAQELYRIFILQLERHGWTVVENCEHLFVHNYKKFENAGGDCHNIAFKAKLEYSGRFWNKKKQTKCLKLSDIQKGFDDHFVHNIRNDHTASMYI